MTTYIAHHGILGMKWGVRRYQNYDGSLTNEGKNRYGKMKKAMLEKRRKKALTTKNAKVLKKNADLLSETELNEGIKRINKEILLQDLVNRQKKSSRAFIAKFANKTLNSIGDEATKEISRQVIKEAKRMLIS